MVWYSLKVGNELFRIRKLEAKKPKFQDVSENGIGIKRVCRQKGIYAWVDEANTEYATRYKLINGKVMGSLTRTKDITNFKEVEKSEAQDLISEQTFYVEGSKSFLNKLKEQNKALLFGYTTSGFEGGFYRAYIFVENDNLMMNIGNAFKSVEIAEAKNEEITKATTKKEIVERAKVDDFIKI